MFHTYVYMLWVMHQRILWTTTIGQTLCATAASPICKVDGTSTVSKNLPHVCFVPMQASEHHEHFRTGEVHFTGLGEGAAAALIGPVRLHVEVDSVWHPRVIQAQLRIKRTSVNLRCRNETLSRLVAGKVIQPWSYRFGQDGALEVLLPLKVR